MKTEPEILPSMKGKWTTTNPKPSKCLHCDGAVRSRGLCAVHYRRWYNHGDINLVRNQRPSPRKEWVDASLDEETDECILFPLRRNADGYAYIMVMGRERSASAYVCEKTHGLAPTDKHQAAHSCGRGRDGCVNKRHISWKTPAENIADKWAHGTMPTGERHHQAKLTESDVRAIRASKNKIVRRHLAMMYGVGVSTIDNVLDGVTWRDVQ